MLARFLARSRVDGARWWFPLFVVATGEEAMWEMDGNGVLESIAPRELNAPSLK